MSKAKAAASSGDSKSKPPKGRKRTAKSTAARKSKPSSEKKKPPVNSASKPRAASVKKAPKKKGSAKTPRARFNHGTEDFRFPPPPQTTPKYSSTGLQVATAADAVVAGVTEAASPTAGVEQVTCLLECQFNDGVHIGTGVLIGPRSVATVAHNIYNGRFGGPVQGITVFPGRNGFNGVAPAHTTFSHCWIPPGWAAFSDAHSHSPTRPKSDLDYGVINFPSDPGWGLPAISLDDTQFDSTFFESNRLVRIGYPESQATGTGYGKPSWARGFAVEDGTRYLTHGMIAERGESGGPIYFVYTDPNSGVTWGWLLGIQSLTFGSAFSLGVRVTPIVYRNLLNNRVPPP